MGYVPTRLKTSIQPFPLKNLFRYTSECVGVLGCHAVPEFVVVACVVVAHARIHVCVCLCVCVCARARAPVRVYVGVMCVRVSQCMCLCLCVRIPWNGVIVCQ
jgi:hypothetical protein